MYKNRYKYFRWTARTGWLTFAYVVAFPSFLGYLAIITDVSGFSATLFKLLAMDQWAKRGGVHREEGSAIEYLNPKKPPACQRYPGYWLIPDCRASGICEARGGGTPYPNSERTVGKADGVDGV